MAELIPLEYRVAVQRRWLVKRWLAAGVLVVFAAAACTALTWSWQRRQAAQLVLLDQQFAKAAALLANAEQLQRDRDDLAVRMRHVQRLLNDTALLTFVQNVSAAVSPDDCLRNIRVEIQPADGKSDALKYQLEIQGLTRDDTTHSHLLDRLTEIGQKSRPPMKVNLGEKHKGAAKDGEATFFNLTCEPLPPAGAIAGAG
jgi:hypothetical protein